MKDNSRNGFVLMEVMPAFVLFLAFLLSGMRMLRMQIRIEEAAWMEELTREAVLHARELWNEAEGQVMLVVLDGNGNWEIVNFPDEDWLPDGGFEAPSPDVFRLFLRRREVQLADGYRTWCVERLSPDGHWQGLQTVLSSPFADSGTGDRSP